MTTLREAAQQALETLEVATTPLAKDRQEVLRAQAALRAALAEPVQEQHPLQDDQQLRDDAARWKNIRGYVEEMEREIQALRAALAEPDTCTWQQDGDSESGVYGTSCRRYFSLEDGTPEDNKMSWCCYCGKKLAQELITEDEDD